MDTSNCKEYCNCAREAMASGACRDWVDGTQDNCPLRPKEEKGKNPTKFFEAIFTAMKRLIWKRN